MRLKEILLASSLLFGSALAEDSNYHKSKDEWPERLNKSSTFLNEFYRTFCLDNADSSFVNFSESFFGKLMNFSLRDSVFVEYLVPVEIEIKTGFEGYAKKYFDKNNIKNYNFANTICVKLPLNYFPEIDSLPFVKGFTHLPPNERTFSK